MEQSGLVLLRGILEQQLEELNLVREKVKTLRLTPEVQAKADAILERQFANRNRVLAEVNAGRKPGGALLKDGSTKATAMAVMQLLSPEQQDTLLRRITSPQVDGQRMLKVLRHDLGMLAEIKPQQMSAAEGAINEAEPGFRSLPDERPVDAAETAAVQQRYYDMSGALGVKLSGILTPAQRDELFGLMPILSGKVQSQTPGKGNESGT